MRSYATALIIIDMLNSYDHEDGEPLKESARRAVPVIAALLAKAAPYPRGIPVIVPGERITQHVIDLPADRA